MVSPELLRRFSYFVPIDEESLKELAMIAEEQTFPSGSVLFDEGDPADQLMLIVDGEVDLRYTLGNGEQRTVDTVVAGEMLVWSAVVEPHRCTATGTAVKETRVVAVDAIKLRRLCQDDPVLSSRLMGQVASLLSERLEAARVQLATV